MFRVRFGPEQWRLNSGTPNGGDGPRPDRRNLAEATVRKRCSCAKQFFDYAVDAELIRRHPFGSKKIPTDSIKADQKAIVTPQDAVRIIDHLPNSQWRLLFALARFGGPRVPSEPQRLRWSDIDWVGETITVHSPKTEHHRGHETRTIPIFGELLPYLRERWDAAAPREELILPMLHGKSNSYCRKPVIRAIKAAGLTPWSKLYSTLRANRDTELREDLPGHVVDAWIGHDERVAKRNYLQITDDHRARATQREVGALNGAASVSKHV